ncbi:MAG TPA: polyprenyl synthetase family protein [Clostridia bacterium]|nr:polyprenyl synthetase family protein [Clostridia bacterium]HQM96552.1 polyprenyl synthetase family protein [Clostridia bacterium]
MTGLDAFIKEYGNQVTVFINDRINESKAPDIIKEACLYSINAGGKRIRPVLFLMTLNALNVEISKKHIAYASSIEMIHTYSLIHDDLPPMDDDDYRRGQPTSHIKYGQAYAILAGDALLNLSFETMLDYASTVKDIAAARDISKASGYEGMVGGQVLDMNKPECVKDILKMYSLKTGALIKTSVVSAAIMAGSDKSILKRLSDYAENLGIAFQLRDDFLDKTDINEITGKPKNSDKKNNKSTYISKRGNLANEIKLHKHTKNALAAIQPLDESYDKLRSLAEYLDNRMK